VRTLMPMTARALARRARFFAQANAVNVIKHPSIVEVFDLSQLPDVGVAH
jgi:hypothetical protein